jgi:hypothetical protein
MIHNNNDITNESKVESNSNSSKVELELGSFSHPVKKNVWDSFEKALVAKSKTFIRDIALRLSIPENVLIKEIFSSKNTIKAYIYDTCSDESYCTALVPLSNGKLAARCRSPVHIGTSYCLIHQYSRPTVQYCLDKELPIPKPFYRLQENSNYSTLWFDAKGIVYDSSLTIRGYFNIKTKKLTLANFNK